MIRAKAEEKDEDSVCVKNEKPEERGRGNHASWSRIVVSESTGGPPSGKQRADPDLTVGASLRYQMTDFDPKASDESGRSW
jgi:hypothetical protein